MNLTTPMSEGKSICPNDIRFKVDAPVTSEDLILGQLIGGGNVYYLKGPARAQDLRFDWGPERPVSLPGLGPPRWLRVFQEPWEKNVHEFTASGLTAGGRHGWKYEWRWESVETGCPAQ